MTTYRINNELLPLGQEHAQWTTIGLAVLSFNAHSMPHKCLHLFIAIVLEDNKNYPISTIELYSNMFQPLRDIPQAEKISIKLETSLNCLVLS